MKAKARCGHIEPRRFAEHQARIGERRDHQSVPVGEHFVVEAGTHARPARGEKFCPQRGEPRLVGIAARLRFEPVENVVAFEIAFRRHVVMAREKFAVFAAELTHHLVVGPDVEFAFLALGIGVERRGERALACRHFAREPGDGLARALPVKRLAGAPVCDGQEFEELGVVVEHFLEMRREPALVDRVAGKAAAEMIEYAALADVVERDLDGGKITRFAGAQPGAPQELEQRRLRKFRRAAGAAVDRIDDAAELARGIVEFGDADRDGAAASAPSPASRSISAARLCSIFCGSSRNSRATSRSTSTKAGLP